MLTCTPALDTGAKGEECCITFMIDVCCETSLLLDNIIYFIKKQHHWFLFLHACMILSNYKSSHIPMTQLIVPGQILIMSTPTKNLNLAHKLTGLALYWIKHQIEDGKL